jgi:hypothetical protein
MDPMGYGFGAPYSPEKKTLKIAVSWRIWS